jgi:hypothetical protein
MESKKINARVSAKAIKIASIFSAKDDIRTYLKGVNIRPLSDGTAMISASDGHTAIVLRDENGFVGKEVTISICKDLLKYANNPSNVFVVFDNGKVVVQNIHSEEIFIQPGNSLIDGKFPRLEKTIKFEGYKKGILGSYNPKYLFRAITLSKEFAGSISFFHKEDVDVLIFSIESHELSLDCIGAIMPMHGEATLPTWFNPTIEQSDEAEK